MFRTRSPRLDWFLFINTRSSQFFVAFTVTDLQYHVIIPLPQTGTTPLIIASENGYSNVVTILLRNGAGVDVAKNVSHLILVRLISLATIIVFNASYFSGQN